LIATAQERVAERSVVSGREWIRSEAEAALLWVFRSPAVAEGLYGCADVGAGTTDVSFFRIRSRFDDGMWLKDALGFYSSRSTPPAVDVLDDGLAEAEGRGRSPLDLRGQEDAVIKEGGLAVHGRVQAVCSDIFETYRCTWVDAYRKVKAVEYWKYRLFVLGGGSKIQPVVDALRESVSPQHVDRPPLLDAGVPEDLCEWSADRGMTPFRGEATFLLVAYGLSWLGTDVPEVDTPSEMPTFEVRRKVKVPIDQDEYYPR